MTRPAQSTDTRPSAEPAQLLAASERPRWTFLTNHGHVLLAVATGPDRRVSDIAAEAGITTRATMTILNDLENAGYLRRTHIGRRTHYTLDPRRHFRHHLTADHEVGELLAIFATPAP
ncbi:helix-turn-helix transcriptional regulator [Agrococcus sp. TSP3-2-1]|uniref:helix-turn-helix transcriptional regulator n=1 Tax=Agrococcus sp. TSP3-2-1 TaxID=2804583 RepID=UPI003CF273BA